MSRPVLILASTLLAAFLGSSCAPMNQFSAAAPSPKLIAEARTQPKDRHGMPVYHFQQKQRLVRTTAYTCTECDHLIYGNKSAAGSTLLYGRSMRSAAADWSYYPLGTTFRIKGMPGVYVIDDYGSALTGTGTIDLYKPSHELMNRWGLRQVEVQVVQWGSMRRSAELLSKRTRYPHCRQMLANILRIQPALRQYAQLDEEPSLSDMVLAGLAHRKSVW